MPQHTDAAEVQIIEALRWARNAPKSVRLFDEGDITGYVSQPEADTALCAIIAFRAGPNPALIDAIFRRFALYQNNKWERTDYRASTIQCGVYHHFLRGKPSFVTQHPKKQERSACTTPHVTQDELEKAFDGAMQRVIREKDAITAACRETLEDLDTAELDANTIRLQEKATLVVVRLRKMIEESARVRKDQVQYQLIGCSWVKSNLYDQFDLNRIVSGFL